ncbi:hypothetical protein [Paraburkholderia terrae]
MPELRGAECVAARVKQRAAPEPSQITVGVARPVAADEPVRADIDNLMSLLAQEVQRRRHEHLVALVVQLRYGLDIPVKTLARAGRVLQ